jgi:hypothetical protein
MWIAAAAVLIANSSILPAIAQEQPAKGKEAVEIVTKGNIRASSSEGFQGFLLLVEFQGKNYTCSVNATGLVQGCYPLYW